MPEHTVQQGDTIASLSQKYDVPSKLIWDDGGNKSGVRSGENGRKDPNLLYPGDKVVIPDLKEKKDQGANTAKKHVYEIKNEYITIELRLLDGNHKPHKDMKVEVLVDGVPATTGGPQNKCSGKTTGDGVVKIEKVLPGTRTVTITYQGRSTELQVGGLDPIETKSGVIGRLKNLGFLRTDLTGDVYDVPDDDADFVTAVRGFQRQYVYTSESEAAKANGVLDDKTCKKLKDIHGC